MLSFAGFSNPSSVTGYFLLFIVGCFVSFVNSISGGGSILSLPILIFMGLPSAVANGTNRLGVLMGSLGSLVGFRSKGIFLPRLAWQVGWPAALGSVFGSLIAIKLPDKIFNPILGVVIVFVVVMTLRNDSHIQKSDQPPAMKNHFLAKMAYVGIGFYGGFLQAGSGLIMIYVFGLLGNLDLFRINALKVFNTVLFISVSLVTFIWAGKINWPMALALGVGNWVGGWAGSHWQIKYGEIWVKRFVVMSGFMIALKLLWDTCTSWNKV